ncbi:class I SAM-dependent methyltransferase [Ruegeria meonggei]|uniref:Glycine/sarcosine/dimethylglycine N-methyltransferase n=1 Tax=Ruegeria meonggei TaxID=1446476 RepID=A0A1X6ZDI6_9RHOB|nr:class I SAM-dependent methyltransferase [Ruegeria meonggei]SLN48692.1 Glycine/sarcosine/dimethylglycine N-methyltransferase [Ruegeria meonggei]
MGIQSSINQTADFTAIKAKQNVAWGAGDYAKVGVTLQITGEELAEAMDMTPDAKVLDVAAGNGNATLAFARRFCDVTSTDYVEALLKSSGQRAQAEGLFVTYKVADAEDLPFEDQMFDAVVSTFGVMFTPNQQQSAAELQRVVKPGGKIGMANWTPESFIGQLFKTIGKHVPPPAGVNSPALWGSRAWVDETFGTNCDVSSFRRKNFMFRYRSAEHFLEYFRTFYGPMQKAFEALDADGQAALRGDILALIEKFDVSTNDSLCISSEYAEIIVARR